ncbi:hypothetical protein CHELA1G11_20731 [Hyphomicrobiales bacterium]|nr:hypothetical protein CHELA1G11_20731 [Hyphomicrobiales bacterium]CAH1691657.1 hypothetical protein CHELA1G2_21046 [Hyphomicrobiales bacterium]
MCEHGMAGLMPVHGDNVLKLFDLTDHLWEASILADLQPNAALPAFPNSKTEDAFNVV